MSDNTIDQLSRDLERARGRIAELEAAERELRQVQQALPRAAQQWQHTFDAMNDAVCLLDMAGIVRQCNKAMVRLLGKPPSEIVGRPCWQVVHELAERPAGCPFERALQTRRREALDLQLNDRWFQAVIDPILDEDGQVTGVVHVLTDITEHKLADDLIQAQRDLALALSAASRLDDGLRLCLEAALRVSGMDCGGVYVLDKASGALDLVLHQGLSPDFVQSVSHYDADSASARLGMADKPIYTEYVHLGLPLNKVERREGLHAIAVLLIYQEDRVIGCLNVASHTRDEMPAYARVALETVVAQAGNSIARLQAEEALREAEGRYRAMFENASNAVAVYRAVEGGRDFVFVDFNRAAESIDGVLREAVIGRRVSEAFPGVKEFGLFDVFRRVWKTGKPEQFPVALYKDERISGWRDNYVYKMQSGEVVAIYSDETARKRAEAEIQRLAKFPSENPNPVLRVAEDATLLFANEAASPLLAQWGCAVGQHLPEPWAQRILDALQSGTPTEVEASSGTPPRVLGGGGQQVFSMTLAPVQDGPYVNMYGLDITARRQAEDAFRRRSEELAALYDTALALASQLDQPQLLQTIVTRATALLACTSGTLYLYRPEQDDLELAVSHGLGRDYTGTTLQRGEGLAGSVLESKQQISVDNYHTWAGRAAVFEDAPLGAILAVPITWAGQILGVVNVEREAGAAFDEEDARLLSLFANQAAVALATARLFEQAEARGRHVQALLDINATLRSTLPLREVLEMIVRRTGESLGYAGTLILVPDATGKGLRLGAAWGMGLLDAAARFSTHSLDAFRLPLSAEANPIVQAYSRGDLQTTSGEPERLLAGLNPAVALDVAPLLSAATGAKRGIYLGLRYGDKAHGVLIALSSRTELPQEERGLLLGLADQAGLAIENALRFEEVRSAGERLRALSRRLVQVQEQERRHVARELHDQIGQVLTGLKITLDMAAAAPPAEVGSSLGEAQALAAQLLTQVRDLSLTLRPAMLDDLGLLPSLLWHVQHYSAQTGVQVSFTHHGLEGRRFSADVETAAYRIAQEALTNVARHAGVKEVAVRAWADEDTVSLEVRDEGRGFDPAAALAAAAPGTPPLGLRPPGRTASRVLGGAGTPSRVVGGAGTPSRVVGGAGLVGMHERAALLGGQLVVESAPGKGTSVRAVFPGAARDRLVLPRPRDGETLAAPGVHPAAAGGE